MRPILWRRCNGTRPHLVEAFGTPIRVTEIKGMAGNEPADSPVLFESIGYVHSLEPDTTLLYKIYMLRSIFMPVWATSYSTRRK